MKKLNVKGFGAVEGLLIFVVLGIIGGTGWYVYSSQKQTVTEPDNTIQSQTKAQSTDFSLTTRLTSLNNKFSLLVPDGWKFVNDTELDYAYATDMNYKSGEAGIIDNEFGHRGGGFTKTSWVIQYSKDELKNYFDGSKSDGTLKLNDNKVAKRYMDVITDDELGIPDGSKSYGYQLDYSGGTIVIRYLVNPTDLDQRDLVEASIKTLTAN